VKEQPERPKFEFDKLPASASDGQKVLALAQDWPLGPKHELGLKAVIAGCN
jgi:hypothetical protein